MEGQQTMNTVTTLAGSTGGITGHQDGEGTAALFTNPSGVAVLDEDGSIVVADMGNHRIRKITTQGYVSTLAGTGVKGHLDGEGAVALFDQPFGVAVDGDSNVIVADTSNNRIRKITPQGLVSTLAGTGVKGHRDGDEAVALFDQPCGIAVDGDGNVIVADMGNHRIRKITSQGHVSTLAGTGVRGHRDGEGAVALFAQPCGVAVDGDGSIIVANLGNHRIRKITPQGQVFTLAGSGESSHRDGEGSAAKFNHPFGVAVDGDGNVIVTDWNNHLIRKITPEGHVSTLAGTGERGHRDGDSVTASAQFNNPRGVAVDQTGNVIVADTMNNCIRCVATEDPHRCDSSSGDFTSMFGAGFKEGDSAE